MNEGEWVTYRDLARRRGVRLDTATALAKRKGWLKQPNNKGITLVLVPEEELEPLGDPKGEWTSDPPWERLIEAQGKLSAAEALASERLGLLEDTQRHLEAMRTKAAELEARAASAEASTKELREALARERQVVDELRRPWWRRWWS